MKYVIKPSSREESVHYSDFNGKCFGDFEPEVTVSFQFNYGSKYDGAYINFDLTDSECKLILDVIKANISEEFKDKAKKQLSSQQKSFEDALDSRDYSQCTYMCNSSGILKFLIE